MNPERETSQQPRNIATPSQKIPVKLDRNIMLLALAHIGRYCRNCPATPLSPPLKATRHDVTSDVPD